MKVMSIGHPTEISWNSRSVEAGLSREKLNAIVWQSRDEPAPTNDLNLS